MRAGLAVIEHEGADALTMRRLATELDTAAASLYVYVANRDELMALLVDQALAEVDAERHPELGWRDRFAQLVLGELDVLGRYPGLAAHIAGTIPYGENALRVSELAVSLLLEGGADDEQAAWAVDLIGLWTTASAIEDSVYHRRTIAGETEEEVTAAARAQFESLDATRFPTMHRLIDELFSGAGDERRRWALEVLLAGVLSVPTRPH